MTKNSGVTKNKGYTYSDKRRKYSVNYKYFRAIKFESLRHWKETIRKFSS